MYARSLVVLGDSTGVGLGDPLPGGGWRGVGPLLARALGARLTNLSFTGARIACVRRTQLPEALAAEPDVAVLIVGMNDTLRSDFDPVRLRADLAAVVADLHATGTQVLLLRYHDHGRVFRLPGALHRALWARIARLNAVTDSVAADSGAGCLDLDRVPGVYDTASWSVDRLHPSERGHRLLAAGFAEVLRARGYVIAEPVSLHSAGGARPNAVRHVGNIDGVGDQLTMCFDFIGMQRMYLSLARADAGPVAEALRERPQPPRDGHWATFVRNHDELTLDKLSESERAEVFAAFGPDPDMQLYGRGLRRRVPAMLDGDARRIRMVYSLLFSLPGTPVLFYGEEIGMAEDLRAEGRLAVRTPMQWNAGRNGGFSTADPADLPGPIPAGQFGPHEVNVEAQQRDPGSLLSWIKLLIERYRECPELAWGRYTILDTGEPSVLAHRSDIDGGTVIAAHNLTDTAVTVHLELDGMDQTHALTDLLGIERAHVSPQGRVELSLGPYGCRWLRAHGAVND